MEYQYCEAVQRPTSSIIVPAPTVAIKQKTVKKAVVAKKMVEPEPEPIRETQLAVKPAGLFAHMTNYIEEQITCPYKK